MKTLREALRGSLLVRQLIAFPALARSRLYTILFVLPVEPYELAVCLFGLSFGVWLVNPFVDVFGSSPSYANMALLAPAWAWGLFVLAGATGKLLALIYNSARGQRAMAIIGIFQWFFVWFLFVLSNYHATATAIYTLPVLGSLLVFFRLGKRNG